MQVTCVCSLPETGSEVCDLMKTYSAPKRRKIRGELSRYYYVREYDTVTRAQRWINTGKASLDAARKYRKRIETLEAEGKTPAQNLSFTKAVDRWLATKKPRMSAGGYRAYEVYAKSWKDSIVGSVREVEPRHVQRYFDARILKVSCATLNKERSYLKQFFEWAIDNELVAGRNPVRIKRYEEEEREIRALAADEQERLLAACRDEYKAKVVGFRNAGGVEGRQKTTDKRKWEQTHRPPLWLEPTVRLALWTGLRLGNLLGLRWSDIDLDGGEIRIPAKRMKKRREFRIPLDARTVAFLRKQRRRSKSMSVLGLPSDRVVTRAFEGAVKRAKVEPCRFHDLRATFISDCGRAGVPLDVACKLAGHRSITTTAKHYRAIDDDELRAAMEQRASGGKQEEKGTRNA